MGFKVPPTSTHLVILLLVSYAPSPCCPQGPGNGSQNLGVVQKEVPVVQWIWPSCTGVLKRGELLVLLTAENLAWPLGWATVLPGDGTGLSPLLSQKAYPMELLWKSPTPAKIRVLSVEEAKVDLGQNLLCIEWRNIS